MVDPAYVLQITFIERGSLDPLQTAVLTSSTNAFIVSFAFFHIYRINIFLCNHSFPRKKLMIRITNTVTVIDAYI
jgi:hypothetical protein